MFYATIFTSFFRSIWTASGPSSPSRLVMVSSRAQTPQSINADQMPDRSYAFVQYLQEEVSGTSLADVRIVLITIRMRKAFVVLRNTIVSWVLVRYTIHLFLTRLIPFIQTLLWNTRSVDPGNGSRSSSIMYQKSFAGTLLENPDLRRY